MTHLANVQEFHKKNGLPVADAPTTDVEASLAALRMALLDEEVEELRQAAEQNDLVAIADALADATYVLYGTALTYGIDLDRIVAEVHRSNMTKSPPGPGGGKPTKGPAYQPPRLADLLGIPS